MIKIAVLPLNTTIFSSLHFKLLQIELFTTLGEVESLVTANPSCEVVLAADLNYDMRRNNHFTRTMAASLEKMGLTSVWQGREVDHTHMHTDGINSSIIDHFLVSRRLLELVEDCGPIHCGDNLSRHSSIFLRLRLGEVCQRQAGSLLHCLDPQCEEPGTLLNKGPLGEVSAF